MHISHPFIVHIVIFILLVTFRPSPFYIRHPAPVYIHWDIIISPGNTFLVLLA